MKKLLPLLALLSLGAGCQQLPTSREQANENPSNSKVFCSPEGELVSTQTIQSHRSYCLQTQKQEPVANQPIDFSFAIIDDQGEKLTEFHSIQEGKIHAVLIRRDLKTFAHLHPEPEPISGSFTLKDLTLPDDGSYRLLLYFTPKNSPTGVNNVPLQVVLSETITVGDSEKNQTVDWSNENLVKNVDQFTVSLQAEEWKIDSEAKFNFNVQGKDGQPIEHVSLYEGQLGNAVIVKADILEPVLGQAERSITNIYNQIPFVTMFPNPGKYKVWLEFKYGKKVYTVDYNIEVK